MEVIYELLNSARGYPIICEVMRPLDPYEVRKGFPILEGRINGKKLVYLNNAATSQKSVQVINAARNYYLMNNANIRRAFTR